MSPRKRKHHHSEDPESDEYSPSQKKTKHKTAKHKTKKKVLSKAVKRPRSLFERRRIEEIGAESDEDLDWIAETQLKNSSTEDEDFKTVWQSEKTGLKKGKGKKKKHKKKIKNDTCEKRNKEAAFPKTKFVCQVCQKVYSTPKALKKHVYNHHWTCNICQRIYKVKQSFEDHLDGHKRDEKSQIATGGLKCFNCLKSYDDLRKLGTHRMAYCPQSSGSLRKEREAIHGEKSGIEDVNQDNATKSIEIVHADSINDGKKTNHKKGTRKVTDPSIDKSIRCPKCNLVCSGFAKLKMHNMIVHINKGLDVYKCNVCHKGFCHPSYLKSHKEASHGQGNFKCDYCHLVFASRSRRSTHVYQFHKFKSYICENCGKMITNPRHRSRCTRVQIKKKNRVSSSKAAPSSNAAGKEESLSSVELQQLNLKIPITELYKCRECSISFEIRENYIKHKSTCQSETDGKEGINEEYDGRDDTDDQPSEAMAQERKEIHECATCGDLFGDMLGSFVHQAEHKNVKCKGCDETMPDEATLQMHVLLECPGKHKHCVSMTQECVTFTVNGNTKETTLGKSSSKRSRDVSDGDVGESSSKRKGGIISDRVASELLKFSEDKGTDEKEAALHNAVIVCEDQSSEIAKNEILGAMQENTKCGNPGSATGERENANTSRAGTEKSVQNGIHEKSPGKLNKGRAREKKPLFTQCDLCNRMMKANQLYIHKKRHKVINGYQSKTGQFQCPLCSKCFNTKRWLWTHQQFYCDVKYSNEDLDQAETGRGDCECNICKGRFENEELLHLHKKVHFHFHQIGGFVGKPMKKCLRATGDGQSEEQSEQVCGKTKKDSAEHDKNATDLPDDVIGNDEDKEGIAKYGMANDLQNRYDEMMVGNDEESIAHKTFDQGKSTVATNLQDDKGTKSQARREIDLGATGNTQSSSSTVCNSCKVVFPTTAALKEHQKRVSLTKPKYPHVCLICKPRIHMTVIESECHNLQHRKQFKFVCQFCGMHFQFLHLLRGHVKKWHDYRDNKSCPGCHKLLSKEEYDQHVEYNRKEVESLNRKCLSCGKVFPSISKLDRHGTLNKYHCRMCNQHFLVVPHLHMHRKKVHNIRTTLNMEQSVAFKCQHCDKSFEKPSELSAHVKSVLEKESASKRMLCSWEYKQSLCLRCGLTFAEHSDYKLHKHIWRHECNLCKEHYHNESSITYHLNKHRRMQATDLEKRTFTTPQYLKCKYCGHNFSKRSDKRDHEWRAARKESQMTDKFPLPCPDCGEIIETICQLDLHERNHKNPAILSCRFCRLAFKTPKGLKARFARHSKAIQETCPTCGVKLFNLCQKKMHGKKHLEEEERKQDKRSKYEISCGHCGALFPTETSKETHQKVDITNGKKSRCSVCDLYLSKCQIAIHKDHVVNKLKGQQCGYCLKTISLQGNYATHQQFADKGYLCSCGKMIQGECQKQVHEASYRFACLKCGGHFPTYLELVEHLIRYNISNVVNNPDTAADGKGGLSVMDVKTWQRKEQKGEMVFICLYCQEKFQTMEEVTKHKSAFKYECPQCRKHFRSPLTAIHHFKQVEHDLAPYAEKPKQTKVGGTQEKNKKAHDDDILQVYSQQALCNKFTQQYQQQQSSEKSTSIILQIGVDIYSVLCNKRAEVSEVRRQHVSDMCIETQDKDPTSPASDDSEATLSADEVPPDLTRVGDAQNEHPVHVSSEILKRSDGVSSNVDKDAMGAEGKRKQHMHDCIFCNTVFGSKARLSKHQGKNTINEGLLYKCVKCDRSFDVECHVENHVGHICKHCGEHFGSIEAAACHEKECGSGESSEEKKQNIARKCDFCSKTAERHRRSLKYLRNLKCFQNDNSLKWITCFCIQCNTHLPSKCHINYHLQLNPHQCGKKQRCGKHFREAHWCRNHFCSWCQYCKELNFGSKNALKKHMHNWHQLLFKYVPMPETNTDATAHVNLEIADSDGKFQQDAVEVNESEVPLPSRHVRVKSDLSKQPIQITAGGKVYELTSSSGGKTYDIISSSGGKRYELHFVKDSSAANQNLTPVQVSSNHGRLSEARETVLYTEVEKVCCPVQTPTVVGVNCSFGGVNSSACNAVPVAGLSTTVLEVKAPNLTPGGNNPTISPLVSRLGAICHVQGAASSTTCFPNTGLSTSGQIISNQLGMKINGHQSLNPAATATQLNTGGQGVRLVHLPLKGANPTTQVTGWSNTSGICVEKQVPNLTHRVVNQPLSTLRLIAAEGVNPVSSTIPQSANSREVQKTDPTVNLTTRSGAFQAVNLSPPVAGSSTPVGVNPLRILNPTMAGTCLSTLTGASSNMNPNIPSVQVPSFACIRGMNPATSSTPLPQGVNPNISNTILSNNIQVVRAPGFTPSGLNSTPPYIGLNTSMPGGRTPNTNLSGGNSIMSNVPLNTNTNSLPVALMELVSVAGVLQVNSVQSSSVKHPTCQTSLSTVAMGRSPSQLPLRHSLNESTTSASSSDKSKPVTTSERTAIFTSGEKLVSVISSKKTAAVTLSERTMSATSSEKTTLATTGEKTASSERNAPVISSEKSALIISTPTTSSEKTEPDISSEKTATKYVTKSDISTSLETRQQILKILPNGFMGLMNGMFASGKAIVTTKFVLGDKTRQKHYVEFVTVNKDNYLKFSHPPNHTGVVSLVEQHNLKETYLVTILPVPSDRDTIEDDDALVVKVTQCQELKFLRHRCNAIGHHMYEIQVKRVEL